MIQTSLFKIQKFKLNLGFTIVELLIYMGLLTILLSILTSVFVSALDVQSESRSASGLEQDGSYIIARLTYDITRASSITLPASLGSTGNTLQINVNAINNSYAIDGSNNFVVTNNLGTNTLNSYDTKLTAFTVQRLGNVGGAEDTIKIDFTLVSRTSRIAGAESKSFQSTVAMRRQ